MYEGAELVKTKCKRHAMNPAAPPIITIGRLPILSARRPLVADNIAEITGPGAIANPDLRTDHPHALCKNSGRTISQPKNATIKKTEPILATVKDRSWNNLRSNNGS
jgi:hypothetical protein